MGFLSDIQKNGGGAGGKYAVGGLNTLVRRKQVDSQHTKSSSSSGSRQYQLARALTAPHLIAIGTPFFAYFLASFLICNLNFGSCFLFFLFLSVWWLVLYLMMFLLY